LFEDAAKRTFLQIVAQISGDGDPAQLNLVLILTMASFLMDKNPTIIQHHCDSFADFLPASQ